MATLMLKKESPKFEDRRTMSKRKGTSYMFVFVCLMVFNATFNNISVKSSWSVLLVEETGVQCTRRKPLTCHKSLTNFIT
jgi:hypothetical protein